MLILKIPVAFPERAKLEAPFKELSLAYQVEESPGLVQPMALSGNKSYDGQAGIDTLIAEMQDYYGDDYNCSCAR
ncbi:MULTISPECIES: hypothetical protein [Reichenbachiella]|uniref:hypothetical protein n=1 Tax=Reichenbachiella TaxID=156993 RepID=UPI000EEA48ED|nr:MULTISPECIES: hypothetical protein [Reichenbachiella]MBU2915167.1 hypothetical protein [Reichenbachiella agariperforans]RJE70320.1 hypothetical protein BGP76_09460 [Reichenbachiella sp. MSK19-1]